MLPDVAYDFGTVSQESDVAGIGDRLKPGACDPIGKRSLSRDGHDHVAYSRKHQGRRIDSPESIGNVKGFEPRQPLCNYFLIGLPDPIDDEIDQRTRFWLRAIQKMEKLIDEWVVDGQRVTLKGTSRDRGPDRPMESSFGSVQN